jgi:hypothetical protein
MRRAVPYLTVGFGTRPQRLKQAEGAKPYQAPKPPKPSVVVSPTPGAGAVTTSTVPVGNAPAGRPPEDNGKFLIRPSGNTDTGYEMRNTKPDVLKAVEDNLEAVGMPKNLRPKLYKPQALKTTRSKNISRGMTHK